MTYEEAKTELEKINAAIDRIVGTKTSGGAQSYSVGNTRVQRADLAALYARKKELETLIARLNPEDGGVIRYPIFETRI